MTDYDVIRLYIKKKREYCEQLEHCSDGCVFYGHDCHDMPTEEQYNKVINYKPEPKSKKMLEELGFEYHDNDATVRFDHKGIGTKWETIILEKDNIKKYLPAIEQLKEDMENGLYD